MNQIKDILLRVKELSGATTDTAVAELWKISRQDLAHHKRRGSIPYKKVLEFCAENEYSADYLFFGIKTDSLDERIIKLEQDLKLEKRLVSEIKSMMKEIVGKV